MFFLLNHGATQFAVAVTEYPEDLFKGTDRERLDVGRDLCVRHGREACEE